MSKTLYARHIVDLTMPAFATRYDYHLNRCRNALNVRGMLHLRDRTGRLCYRLQVHELLVHHLSVHGTSCFEDSGARGKRLEANRASSRLQLEDWQIQDGQGPARGEMRRTGCVANTFGELMQVLQKTPAGNEGLKKSCLPPDMLRFVGHLRMVSSAMAFQIMIGGDVEAFVEPLCHHVLSVAS